MRRLVVVGLALGLLAGCTATTHGIGDQTGAGIDTFSSDSPSAAAVKETPTPTPTPSNPQPQPLPGQTRQIVTTSVITAPNGSTTTVQTTQVVTSSITTTAAPPPAPVPPPDKGVVTAGAFCSPTLATGHTVNNVAMRCEQLPGDGQARWHAIDPADEPAQPPVDPPPPPPVVTPTVINVESVVGTNGHVCPCGGPPPYQLTGVTAKVAVEYVCPIGSLIKVVTAQVLRSDGELKGPAPLSAAAICDGTDHLASVLVFSSPSLATGYGGAAWVTGEAVTVTAGLQWSSDTPNITQIVVRTTATAVAG